MLAASPSKENFTIIVKDASKYLKLKKESKKSKEKITPKQVYLKTMIQDANGNTRWLSVARQDMQSSGDVAAAMRVIFSNIKGYGNDFSIIGFEVEETIIEETI